MNTGPNFPRTQEQIAARYKDCGPFDFAGEVLLDYLDFAHAQPFLKPEVTEAEWSRPIERFDGFGPETDVVTPISPDNAAHTLDAMRHYAAFGWTKIEDHRGISASRTVDKMGAWVWLLGYDPKDVFNRNADWGQYGAGCLAKVCEHFGFPIPDAEWARRMIVGELCCDDCESGCGQ